MVRLARGVEDAGSAFNDVAQRAAVAGDEGVTWRPLVPGLNDTDTRDGDGAVAARRTPWCSKGCSSATRSATTTLALATRGGLGAGDVALAGLLVPDNRDVAEPGD